MGDATVKPSGGDDLVLSNDDGSAKIEVNEGAEVKVTTGSSSGDDFTINTSQLVVTGNNGNVGIGEVAPTSNDGWGKALEISDANGVDLTLNHTDSTTSQGIAQISFTRDSTTLASVNGVTGSTTSKGELNFRTHNGTSNATRMTVEESGNVTIEDGDLVIGTAGHGIDFSATTDGSGASNVNQVLSYYEQGTFTPLLKGVSGDPSYGGSALARYTRVGNVVHFNILLDLNPYNSDGSGQIFIKGFPFNFDSSNGGNAIAISVSLWGPTIGSGKFIAGQGIGSDNSMKFKIWQSGGAQTFWDYTTASLGAGEAIYVQGHYFVA